ncbi:MAG: tetratricopeptide repeat protein [Desulfopila sp.]
MSFFPYRDFSRTETLNNANKAVLHAKFFEPGHVALFDAVSLNVSGDIYFADGDMLQAVREYRRGLACDPENVNLLNSLGVTYALLNRTRLAQSTFEQVVKNDADNCMALYNLGIGAELRGDHAVGIALLEHAHRSCIAGHDEEFRREIEMQLGKAYCLVGRYRESLRCLESWWQGAGERQQGRMLKYLGEACLGAGKPHEAMGWLQQALRTNELDHQVLSLLGMAVYEACEGDEIALSLCAKSVDIAPDDRRARLRLARIEQHLGLHRQALANLGRCRGRGEELTEIRLLKATSLAALGCNARARYWARTVQKKTGVVSEPYRQAQILLDSLG